MTGSHLENRSHCQSSHLIGRLSYRRQRRTENPRKRDVVKTSYRYPLRHLDAHFCKSRQSTKRAQVIGTDDTRRAVHHAASPRHGSVAVVDPKTRTHDIELDIVQTALVTEPSESVLSCRNHWRARKIEQLAVPQSRQVVDHSLAPTVVVGVHL